jgi:hypothetical protein
MKIGLVIHGPEVIDSGEAKEVFEKLSCMGKVDARLGGAMGKTAVLDARLENIIDISQHLKPSACIESFFEVSDLVCLLNRGKTIETGGVFGKMVFSRLKKPETKSLIHIESPKSVYGKLIPLNTKAGEWIEELSSLFELPTENPLPLNDSIYTEKCPETGETRIIRKLSGVFSGEKILVNGIVIGKALSSEVSIVSQNGFIVALKGGEIKMHGLEKLYNYEEKVPLDLSEAWVKSGALRRSNFSPLQARRQYTCTQSSDFPSISKIGKAVLIDHAAEYVFELASGAKLAVTVGDDTTAIAADILFRLGIPILGITDGDCDNLACKTAIFPGSLVLRLASGNDDIVGKKLKQELFRGGNSTVFEDLYSFKRNVLKLAGSTIEAIYEY